MHLYELPLSLTCFKLRLALALKGLDIAGEPPPGGTYRSAEFAAINPAGTIPTLVDGAFVLAESDAILDYLDDRGLGRPLRPAEPQAAARQRMLSRWTEFRLEAPLRRLFPLIAPGARDVGRIAIEDLAIGRALALFEQSLDTDGPHALGGAAGLADCGLAACFFWFEGLRSPLKLAAQPGPRLQRSVEALAAHPETAAPIAAYRPRVEEWIAARLAA